jgi:hypothetical protein
MASRTGADRVSCVNVSLCDAGVVAQLSFVIPTWRYGYTDAVA